MLRKTLLLLVWLAVLCSTAYAKGERWQKLVEDDDLVYYIDDKSILRTRAGTMVVWIKQASRKKDFLRDQYRMVDLDYILFNYEINCEKGMYKSRGIIYYDRNGNQLEKQVPLAAEMADAEPVPPESILEVIQNHVCPGEEPQSGLPEATPAPPRGPQVPDLPAGPGL